MLISYKDTIHVWKRRNVKQIASANVAITKYMKTQAYFKKRSKVWTMLWHSTFWNGKL